MKVAILMGSTNDFKKVEDACKFLKSMEIEFEIRALSAHRAPEALGKFIAENDDQIGVYIAAAGKAAHLPGVVASKTLKPVVGLPISGSTLDGMDALLSIAQMPPGIPVATVAIDGGKNAGILAAQILAQGNKEIASKLKEYRTQLYVEALEAEKKLLSEINY